MAPAGRNSAKRSRRPTATAAIPIQAALAAANSMAKRDTVEPPADRGDRCQLFSARRDACVQCIHSGDEQLHRAAAQYVVRSLLSESGYIERRDAIDCLAVDPKNFGDWSRQSSQAGTSA